MNIHLDKRSYLRGKINFKRPQQIIKKDMNEELSKEKKYQKEINVKHIYAKPSDQILGIIPFCSKKYTVQRNDA